MQHSQFLDIESSSYDEEGFPIAISWSLNDGSIKSIMIMPDDDWLEDETSHADIDIQHYLDQGVSGIDIVREMNEDLGGQTVFVDGIDDDARLLAKLCETFDTEPDFEVAPAYSLAEDADSFYEERLTLLEQEGLDNQSSRDNVMAMLLFAQTRN